MRHHKVSRSRSATKKGPGRMPYRRSPGLTADGRRMKLKETRWR